MMDGMKVWAKVVVGAGLLLVWPGPRLIGNLARTVVEQIQPQVRTIEVTPSGVVTSATTGSAWFESVKSACNPVEVAVRLRFEPPPNTFEGHAYEAACFALAGRIDEARAAALSLPADRHWEVAGVVFNVGHPAADAGDELAAGPLMELVVEFWPNHYMALYHAGAARFESDDWGPAAGYLERFLTQYETEDGWRSNAVLMLSEMEGRSNR